MKSQALVLALGGALLAACAWTPHEVAITAQAPLETSSVGKGVTVALDVVDDRDDLVVGQRGAGMQGADITVKDIIPALETELKEGLEAKGFTVVSSKDSADAEFQANLRAFKFFIETGFWTGAENVNVVIKVEAEKGTDDFERNYRVSEEDRTMVIPAGEVIDDKLNAALEIVLSKIMADEELMAFLIQ